MPSGIFEKPGKETNAQWSLGCNAEQSSFQAAELSPTSVATNTEVPSTLPYDFSIHTLGETGGARSRDSIEIPRKGDRQTAAQSSLEYDAAEQSGIFREHLNLSYTATNTNTGVVPLNPFDTSIHTAGIKGGVAVTESIEFIPGTLDRQLTTQCSFACDNEQSSFEGAELYPSYTTTDKELEVEDQTWNQKRRPKLRMTFKCLRRFGIILVLTIVGVTMGLSWFFNNTLNPLSFFMDPNYDDLSSGLDLANKWRRGDFMGLEIVVENALDESWVPYFEDYVRQWDDGNPDALRLNTVRVPVDNDCDPLPGRIKVCNGNYGNTDWDGINYFLTSGPYIQWSTSKMNDYHLEQDTEARKKYTMCHELGHAFGLHHTDENHHNANLGDCMDYTMQPLGNLVPGEYNYELLALLYGTIPPEGIQPEENTQDIPSESVKEKYKKGVKKMEETGNSSCNKRGICVEDLGGGYKLVGHKLLVNNWSSA